MTWPLVPSVTRRFGDLSFSTYSVSLFGNGSPLPVVPVEVDVLPFDHVVVAGRHGFRADLDLHLVPLTAGQDVRHELGEVVASQPAMAGARRRLPKDVVYPRVERGVADRAPQLLEALPVVVVGEVVERLRGHGRPDELQRVVQRVREPIPVVAGGQCGEIVGDYRSPVTRSSPASRPGRTRRRCCHGRRYRRPTGCVSPAGTTVRQRRPVVAVVLRRVGDGLAAALDVSVAPFAVPEFLEPVALPAAATVPLREQLLEVVSVDRRPLHVQPVERVLLQRVQQRASYMESPLYCVAHLGRTRRCSPRDRLGRLPAARLARQS